MPLASSSQEEHTSVEREAILALVHLVTVLLSERNYVTAGQYLDIVDRTIKQSRPPISIAEAEGLKRIATFAEINGDVTPNAAAIRLRAHALLCRQVDLKLADPRALVREFSQEVTSVEGLRNAAKEYGFPIIISQPGSGAEDGGVHRAAEYFLSGDELERRFPKTCDLGFSVEYHTNDTSVGDLCLESGSASCKGGRNVSSCISKKAPSAWRPPMGCVRVRHNVAPFATNDGSSPCRVNSGTFEDPVSVSHMVKSCESQVPYNGSDFELYNTHVNRISQALVLPREVYRAISGDGTAQQPMSALAFRRVQNPDTAVSMAETKVANFEWPSSNFDVHALADAKTHMKHHRWLHDEYKKQAWRPKAIYQDMPGVSMIDPSALFMKSFPEELHSLFALLKDHTDIRSSSAAKLARQLGLNDSLTRADLRQAATSHIELRYRYISDQLKRHAKDVEPSELRTESHLLAALIRASRGDGQNSEDVELVSERHQDLLGTLRTGDDPHFPAVTFALGITNQLKAEILEEIERNWGRWVKDYSGEFDLKIARAADRHFYPAGPHKLSQIKLDERVRIQPTKTWPSEEYRAIVQVLRSPVRLIGDQTFESLTNNKPRDDFIDEPMTGSPFSLVERGRVEDVIANAFRERDDEFHSFLLSDHAESKELRDTYDLKNSAGSGGALQNVITDLEGQIAASTQRAGAIAAVVEQAINLPPAENAMQIHRTARHLRGTRKWLTVDDAKYALAMGWDGFTQQLLDVNPALSDDAVRKLFNATVMMLLHSRQTQRLHRIKNIAEDVRVSHNSAPTSVSHQQKMRNFKFRLGETLESENYEPWEDTIMLIMEVGFDIDFFEGQIPAIKALAPKDRAQALVELAMGLGKTDVISPAVICALSDGETLPILVMPESLVPEVAKRLQKRLSQFRKHIRVMSIARMERTAADVNRLHDELVDMMESRSPLVWAATDIQVIINSYVEDMWRGLHARSDTKEKRHAYSLGSAWARLFTFLREHAQIIGDEIHAILDILTSYNFSLGDKEQLTTDEMDAVADFMLVMMKHSGIPDDTKLPFYSNTKGKTPLTDEHFRTNCTGRMVQALLERGITNGDENKAFFQFLNASGHILQDGPAISALEIVRKYLQSERVATRQTVEKATNITAVMLESRLHERAEWAAMEDAELNTKLKNSSLSTGGSRVDRIQRLMNFYSLLSHDRKRIEHAPHDFDIIVAESHALYKVIHRRTLNFLAVQKESLRAVFMLTAAKQKGKHFALNLEKNGAIPAENGKPEYDSLFGTSLERLFYTTFLFLQDRDLIPIMVPHVEADLKKHVRAFRIELALGGEDAFSNVDSDARKKFRARYGDVFDLESEEYPLHVVRNLTAWVFDDPSRLMPLIRDYLFPKTDVYRKEIESSTHMFPMLVQNRTALRGMSGTIYNKHTYPNVFDSLKPQSPTTVLVMKRIKANAPKRARVHAVEFDASSSVKEIALAIDTTSTSSSGWGMRCVIDTTGVIAKRDAAVFAKEMLGLASKNALNTGEIAVEAVAYYNGDDLMVYSQASGALRSYDKDSQDKRSLVAFWDVAHTTGSDIRIGDDQRAIMLVGKHLRLFELAQSAMRLRGLGTLHQRLEIMVVAGDLTTMVEVLNQHLNLGIAPANTALTIDQVMQYALLNEVLQETENNYRAIDMRFRMELIGPIVDALWDPAVSPEKTDQMFECASHLFVREKPEEAWDSFGPPVFKTNITDAKRLKLSEWLANPVLTALKCRSLGVCAAKGGCSTGLEDACSCTDAVCKCASVFPASLTHDSLAARFEANVNNKLENVRSVVEASSLGTKQKQKEMVSLKLQLQVQTEIKLAVDIKEKELTSNPRDIGKRTPAKMIRRNPYPARIMIPPHKNLFGPGAASVLGIESLSGLWDADLVDDALAAAPRYGAGVSAKDVLSLDQRLKEELGKSFSEKDQTEILFSFNLAPVWRSSSGAFPLYAPYDYLQEFPTTALVAEHKGTESLSIKLLTADDTEQLVQLLARDRALPGCTDRTNISTVRLTLYQLQQSRVIAHGCDPVSYGHLKSPRVTDLLAKAKLLSGMTHFTETQKQILNASWVGGVKTSQAAAKRLFDAVATRLLRHRNTTLGQLSTSHFGQLLQASVFGNSTEIAMKQADVCGRQAVEDMDVISLFYDLSLKTKARLTKSDSLQTKENAQQADPFLSHWSDILVPLLPLLFDLPGKHFPADADFSLNDRQGQTAILRRWLMESFYPKMKDEYGAWRTAAPGIRFNASDKDVLRQREPPPEKSDPDSFNFRLDLTTDRQATKRTADLAQMEIMSALADPWLGLPNLVNHSSLAHAKRAIPDASKEAATETVTTVALEGTLPPWKRIFEAGLMRSFGSLFGFGKPEEDSAEAGTAKEKHTGAKTIALAAIASVDLVSSLDSIYQLEGPAYQYELLLGLFQFLAAQNAELRSRSVYGMYLLPRFFGGHFDSSKETAPVMNFIPFSLISSDVALDESRIVRALAESYDGALQWRPERRMSFWWQAMQTISPLTNRGSQAAAKSVSGWLNMMLASAHGQHWFLDGCMYLLFQRDEAMVGHNGLENYITGSHCSQDEGVCRQESLHEMIEYGHASQFSKVEAVVVVHRWQTADFDVLVEILDVNTLGRPELSVEAFSRRLAQDFETNLDHEHAFNAAEISLLKRRVTSNLVGKIATPGSCDVETKIALAKLLDITDKVAARGAWGPFRDVQAALAPLRLVARHQRDSTGDPELAEALKQYPMLFSDERTGHDAVVHTLFLPLHLLPATKASQLTSIQVTQVLQEVFVAARSKARTHRQFCSPEKETCSAPWPQQPDWWQICSTIFPFTFSSDTAAQLSASFEWLAEVLAAAPSTNWMLDSAVLQAVRRDQTRVPYSTLVRYADDRAEERGYSKESFAKNMTSFSNCSARWHANQAAVTALVTLTHADFKLFVELGDVALKQRADLSADELADKLETVFSRLRGQTSSGRSWFGSGSANADVVVNDALLGYALQRLNRAARVFPASKIPRRTRDRISKLVVSVEAVLTGIAGNDDLVGVTVSHSTMVEELNLLRLVSKFSEDVKNATNNIVEATNEFLEPSTWGTLRSVLYKAFIPKQLISLAPGTDKTWIPVVVKTACDHSNVIGRAARRPCTGRYASPADDEKRKLLIFWLTNYDLGLEPGWLAMLTRTTSSSTRSRDPTYKSGDAAAFGKAVDIESKSRVPSWLLDEFVLASFAFAHGKSPLPGQAPLRHSNLRLFTGDRGACTDRFLHLAGHSKGQVGLMRKYSTVQARKGDFDTMFDLARVDTQGRVDKTAEEIADSLAATVAPSHDSKKDIAFVVDVLQTFVLARILPVQKGSQRLRALLRVLDTFLYSTGPATSSNIVTRASDLRLAVEFTDSPMENMVAAITEMLSRTCAVERSYVYRWFVPGVLLPLLPEPAASWVAAVAKAVVASDLAVKSTTEPLTTTERDVVETLIDEVLAGPRGSADELAKALDQHILPRRSAVADRLVVTAMSQASAGPWIRHETLKAHVELSRSPKKLKVDLLRAVSESNAARRDAGRDRLHAQIIRYSASDFDVFVLWGELNTRGARVPSKGTIAATIVHAAGNKLDRADAAFFVGVDGSEREMGIVERYLIDATVPNTNRKGCPYSNESAACPEILNTGLLELLDGLLDDLGRSVRSVAVVQTLRRVVYFTHGFGGNLERAMQDLTGHVKARHALRGQRLQALITSVLLPEAISSITAESPTATSEWVVVWLLSTDTLIAESRDRSEMDFVKNGVRLLRGAGDGHQRNATIIGLVSHLKGKAWASPPTLEAVSMWNDLYYDLLKAQEVDFEIEQNRYLEVDKSAFIELIENLIREKVAAVDKPPLPLVEIHRLVAMDDRGATVALFATLLQAKMKGLQFLRPVQAIGSIHAALTVNMADIAGGKSLASLAGLLQMINDMLLATVTTRTAVGMRCLADGGAAALNHLLDFVREKSETAAVTSGQPDLKPIRDQIEVLEAWRDCSVSPHAA